MLGGDDTQLEAIYNKLHNLGEFTDPKSYKSYDELSKKLYEVLGESAVQQVLTTAESVSLDETDEIPMDFPSTEPATTEPVSEDSDDAMSFFAKLAKED